MVLYHKSFKGHGTGQLTPWISGHGMPRYPGGKLSSLGLNKYLVIFCMCEQQMLYQ